MVTKLAAMRLVAGALAAPTDSNARSRTAEFEHANMVAVLNVIDDDVQILILAATEVGIKELKIKGPHHKVRLSSKFRDDEVGQARRRSGTSRRRVRYNGTQPRGTDGRLPTTEVSILGQGR